MSSPGTGSDISLSVTMDLLHKLITESRKVHAFFACPSLAITATLSGVVRVRASDKTLWVMDLDDPVFGPKLSFNPSLAVVRKYGDSRAFPQPPEGMPTFSFALSFLFEDGSHLGLFESEREE
jgi:hypothetical protein